MEDDNEKNKKFPEWLKIISAIFLIVLILSLVAGVILDSTYKNKILSNIYIGEIKLGRLERHEAKALLSKKIDNIEQNGVPFIYGDRQVVITPLITSSEGDIAYHIINFDADQAVDLAYSFGHNRNPLINTDQKLASLFTARHLHMPFVINQTEIKNILSQNFSGYETPAQDAKLIYARNKYKKNYTFSVQSENLGKKINYDKGLNELINNLSSFDNASITLTEENDYPVILKGDCLNIENQAQKILALAPLTLVTEKNNFTVNQDDLVAMLSLVKNTDSQSPEKVVVGLNKIALKNYLENNLAPQIDKQPTLSKFIINNGRVETFQVGANGLKLDIEKNINLINQAIITSTSTIRLALAEIKTDMLASSTDDFGIKEIIGIGQSNFKGSPKNRRYNIRVGASTLSGVLIKPDEEFSLVKTLGDISSSTGYLPELVIKGNKTTPEYGGGLCQIGTTMFRAALATGLPITARRNHSYRVVYYEPAGTDATIYNPSPDLKFINDTGNYILIQSRIEGDNLYFDFWGTSDGRIATRTQPVIYNITKPGPTKLIETLDLKPGEKKCMEIAHNGADTYFDYKVTYPDATVKEKRFSSHYIPWQAVCMIGVTELSTKNTDNTAGTSTIQNLP